MVRYAREAGRITFRGKRVLELGTGWHGSDVLIFHLAGASEVVTIDAVRHLDPMLLGRMAEVAGTMLDEIAEASGLEFEEVEIRYARWGGVMELDALESRCGIFYRAPATVHTLDLNDRPFDVFYSYSVLQRLRFSDLEDELRAARERLSDDGIALHVIHHSDHNARHDPKLNRLRYLKYPDWLYNAFQSDLINFQNRLRSSEMIDLFEECGYRVQDLDKSYASSELLEGMQVADRFRGLSPSDLRCTRSQVLLRPAGSAT